MRESSSEGIEVTGSSIDLLPASRSSHYGNYKNNLLFWWIGMTTWLKSMLYPTLPQQQTQASTPSGQTTIVKETLGQSLRKRMYDVVPCDVHDILSEKKKVTWSEWYLLLGKNDNAIKITKEFHEDFKGNMKPSKFVESVDKIKELYLQSKVGENDLKNIVQDLEEARKKKNPELVVHAYTRSAEASKRLNTHLATNAYHFLRLYCTILNCPVLHLTKGYVDAFTSILLHQDLEKYRVTNKQLYRGITVENEELLKSYEPGLLILTTTFLSTSANLSVAARYYDPSTTDKKSVLCTYIINNAEGRSALNIQSFSKFQDEEEILILRYIPFMITSKETDANGRINICFEEYSGEVSASPQQESNNRDSIALHDTQEEPETACVNHVQNNQSANCRRNEPVGMSTISYSLSETDADRTWITFNQ